MEEVISNRQRTFLIVDDNEGFRKILHKIIASHQLWSVLGEADNGQRAVQLAGILKPNVVLMDISMPVMNGIQATSQIKQNLPATRIILFSFYHEEEFRVKSQEAGAEFFIWKEELDGQKLEEIMALLFPD